MNTNGYDWKYQRWLAGGIFNPEYEQGLRYFLILHSLIPKLSASYKFLVCVIFVLIG